MSDKQAVLLIHGIGEQLPMETLRGFVRAVWTTDSNVHHAFSPATVWSKPDTVSGSYELRRLTTGKNKVGVRTDFFEFYWAHLMSGTKVSHVTAWARLLLLRPPWTIPGALRGVWYLLVAVTLVVAGLFITNGVRPEQDKLIHLPAWSATVATAVLSSLVSLVVIGFIGDAARYLNPAPTNIKRRQEIRAKGIDVLKKLHQAGYQRIIVVGHSLGSVIGYDVLTYAWAEYNTGHKHPEHPLEESLAKLEALVPDQTAKAKAFRAAQRAYAEEIGANGCEWRVTDFVTLGSPLAHAAILLARDENHLASKQADRELPTCPPVTEKGLISYPLGIKDETGRERNVQVPHHAAVFGPTRWTNLYFPARFIVKGDVIGGPLSPVFGHWIVDLPVSTKQRLGLLSHTLYWAIGDKTRVSDAVRQLRGALDLASIGP